jgi:heptosyltransferase-2
VLVVGVNWLGDAVMTMPALQAWRAAWPGARLALAAKPGLAPLWAWHAAPDEVTPIGGGLAGTLRTARRLRAGGFARAYVFPHSLRSALLPWLARVPARVGPWGHHRDALLTHVVGGGAPAGRHQALEYFEILGLPAPAEVPAPRLEVPEAAQARARERLAAAAGRPVVALLPGAARGRSKQWPPERFAEVGRRLVRERGVWPVVMGAPAERALCRAVAEGAGGDTLDLGGRTALTEWVALLGCCALAVANDSGGMHLATAVGTPVVAVFGRTDPGRTGPLGGRASVVRASADGARDIGRRDRRAEAELAALGPEPVLAECRRRLPA